MIDLDDVSGSGLSEGTEGDSGAGTASGTPEVILEQLDVSILTLEQRQQLRSKLASQDIRDAREKRERAQGLRMQARTLEEEADALDPPPMAPTTSKGPFGGGAVDVRNVPTALGVKDLTQKPRPEQKRTALDERVLAALPKGGKNGSHQVSGRAALAAKLRAKPDAVGAALATLVADGKAKRGGNPPRWVFYYRP